MGVHASPSPPVLYLLHQVQQEHLALQDENSKLKATLEMLTSSPSFVSHSTHLGDSRLQNKGSFPSMISHCIVAPPSEEEKLLTKDDFLKIWAGHQEQVRKDWTEILSKINILNI